MRHLNLPSTVATVAALMPSLALADVFISANIYTADDNPFQCDVFPGTGLQSVHLFVDGMPPGSALVSVYATANDPMTLTTSDPNGFYNSPFVDGALPPVPIFPLCAFADIQWDTWLSIGQYSQDTNSTAFTAGFPTGIAEPDDGTPIVNLAEEAAWFDGSPNDPVLEDNGRVIIAQFTVNETESMTFNVNVQIDPTPPGPETGGTVLVTGLTLFIPPAVNLCPGDFDGDDNVTITDLLQLLAAWGDCPTGCVEDVVVDLTVDIQDLLELLASWGVCAPT